MAQAIRDLALFLRSVLANHMLVTGDSHTTRDLASLRYGLKQVHINLLDIVMRQYMAELR